MANKPNRLPLTFTQIKPWLMYSLAGVIFFVIAHFPIPGFTPSATKTMAVFGVAAWLWITDSAPIAVTGIVILFLLPSSGAITAAATYSYFGNSAVFFVLGAFILASPVMRSGLSTRLAVTIISRFCRGPISLLLSLFCLCAALSFIISEHAVAAMMFPIVMQIVKATGIKLNDRFGFAAFLSMGWGAIIGGTATLLGGARAPLALGLLQSSTSYSINFIGWLKWTFPIVILCLIAAFITIYFVARKSTVCIEAARTRLQLHLIDLGPITQRELATLAIIGVTICLWVMYGSRWGLDTIGLFGVLLAFIFRVTTWKEVEQDVQWSILIMYGAAIALSAALTATGAAHAMVILIMDTGVHSQAMIFGLLILLAYILTEIMSNAAAVAVLMPIGLALSQQFHIDPRAITVALATAAGLTFLLPVSTPAMAIITDCEYVPPARALRWGLIIKAIGFCILMACATWYWPHLMQNPVL